MRLGKVVLAFVLCIVGLFLLTSLKTSLLFLLSLRQDAKPSQWYAALFFVLITPEFITFFRIIWSASFLVKGSLTQWPSCKILFLGVTTTILECGALVVLTLEVAPQVPAYLLMPLLNVILLVQVLIEPWKPQGLRTPADNQMSPASLKSRVIRSVAAIFGFAIFAVVVYLLIAFQLTGISRAVALGTATITLSLVWCQPIKVHVFQAESASDSARNNTALILSLLRIVSITLWSIGTICMSGEIEIHHAYEFLWEGITSLGENTTLVLLLVANCLAGLSSYVLTRLAAFYTTTWSGILIPSIVSTIAASVVYLLNCVYDVFPFLNAGTCPISEDSIIVAGTVVLLWLLPMLIWRRNCYIPAETIFKPEHENFIAVGYNAVCFDQHSLLNYYQRSLVHTEPSRSIHAKSRVFMCTTMYREADYEMKKLLKSMAKLSKSKNLKKNNIYIEAHIFLDNGIEGLTMQAFALQLIDLLENCLAVDRSESDIYKTPYGIQITCTLPGDMPLFVHLKDSSLVKAKKRWSQIMYMNYVIDYRIKMTNDGSGTKDDIRKIISSDGEGAVSKIREFLENAKTPDEEDENEPIRSKCGPDYNSDEGIETGDAASVRSRANSQRDSDDRSTYNPSMTNSSANLLAIPSSFGLAAQLPSSETSSGIYNMSNRDDASVGNMDTFKSAASSSYTLSEYPMLNINPAYVTDEDEAIPPKMPTKFALDSAFPYHSEHNLSSEVPKNLSSVDLTQVTPAYDDNTYILATDADMQFDDMNVLDVVETCNTDMTVGAICGRTHPVGKKIHPLVWFQMFEYAKDFWFTKSAQNIIGSVMCCPGCFSLYRVKALEGVLDRYSEPMLKPGDTFIKDTGEDRWMCTLMMLRGWKLKYSNFAYNITYCPDNMEEFIKQRRRWILSDFANSLIVFKKLPQLMRGNASFSMVHVAYLIQLTIINFLAPASTIILLAGGMDMLLGVRFYIVAPVIMALVILYGYLCIRLSSQVQVILTKLCYVALILCMCGLVGGASYFVVVELRKSVYNEYLPSEYYILFVLVGSFFYAGLLHPDESWMMIHGFTYLLVFPAMQVLLPVYSLCNIIDQSWGTRDNLTAKLPKLSCFSKIKFRRKKKENKYEITSGDAHATPEDTQISEDQLKLMPEEEEEFWTNLVDKVVGKDVNLGLDKKGVADGLTSLRRQVLLAFLVVNCMCMVGLGALTYSALNESINRSDFLILTILLYGFSFVIQFTGMTLYKFGDFAHRIGKAVMKDDKTHWVKQR